MEALRVQELAKESLLEIPSQFVRPPHERPENSRAIEGVKMPLVSLSQPHNVLVDEVSKACSEWGLFMITDHGIPPCLIKELQEVGQEFFQLPKEEKESYANDPSTGNFEGYGTKMTKNLDAKIEWIDYFFHLMSPPSKVNYDIWPKKPSYYRKVTQEYSSEILRIMDKLLELLSEGLGLDGKVLKSCLGGEDVELEMKINMYPPCPQPDLALGVEPHTDMSALTILLPNDVPGLQVCTNGDCWFSVNHPPHALLVHVGDQIEILSNGKYKSVLHRSLVSKERTRMSWAVFCSPPHEALIGPIPELLDEKNPAKYSTKTFAEFRRRKFNKLPQ